MAATSPAGRACVGRDAIPPVLRRVSVQRNGRFHRGHLDRRCAQYRAAHLVRIVADAWAVRVAARWDAGRCPAPCRELARGSRWASGDGKEFVCVLAHQKLRPLGARPLAACRAEVDVLPAALHWWLDALLPAVPQERQAGAGARA